MRMWSLKMIAALALVLGFVVAAPHHTMAGEQQDGQQAQGGDTGGSAPSSADVQERGLNLAPGQVPGTAAIQRPPAPFKCTAATLTCRCYGVSDCNWMRRVMGEYCFIADSCTQNCECRISK